MNIRSKDVNFFVAPLLQITTNLFWGEKIFHATMPVFQQAANAQHNTRSKANNERENFQCRF